MSSLFQQLEIEAFRAGITPRTKESIAWFRRKATQLGQISLYGNGMHSDGVMIILKSKVGLRKK